MIWNVPIESLEERYSKDWNVWFPSEFKRLKVPYQTIEGEALTNKIEHGAFLDVVGTNYYKASQLQKICKLIYEGKVQKGDIFFFHDLWFPGLEMLAYIRDGLGLQFKIAGMLHAGTWDNHDFLSKKGMDKWAEKLEESWFTFIDKIFVATNFHKNLILDLRCVLHSKIEVISFPIYDTFAINTPKEKIIVFPHRLDKEKNPQMFEMLAAACKKELPEWKFIKTKNVTKTKAEYYNLLDRATFAISFAEQETFGIAMQEAVLAGCIPIVPNRLSYSELYRKIFQYSWYDYVREDLACLNATSAKLTLLDMIKQMQLLPFFKDSLQEQKQSFRTNGRTAIERMIKSLRNMK